MQRTLKREFKELEIVMRDTIEVSYSIASGEIQLIPGCFSFGKMGITKRRRGGGG
jgi:hypothetical protein